jgi:hypothetical protein
VTLAATNWIAVEAIGTWTAGLATVLAVTVSLVLATASNRSARNEARRRFLLEALSRVAEDVACIQANRGGPGAAEAKLRLRVYLHALPPGMAVLARRENNIAWTNSPQEIKGLQLFLGTYNAGVASNELTSDMVFSELAFNAAEVAAGRAPRGLPWWWQRSWRRWRRKEDLDWPRMRET